MSITDDAQTRADVATTVITVLRARPDRDYTARQIWARTRTPGTSGVSLADVNATLNRLLHADTITMHRDTGPGRSRRYQYNPPKTRRRRP